MFRPDQRAYIDGSDITGHPRLGAAVVHVPTCTNIYIDAGGPDETRTIMRAELVANKDATHECVGIYTDSLSSLQAIRHRYTNSGAHDIQHDNHHMLLLSGITDLVDEIRS